MLIPKNISPEIKNTLKIESISNIIKIEENVIPVITEYNINKSIAAKDDIFLVQNERIKTTASSAIKLPQIIGLILLTKKF